MAIQLAKTNKVALKDGLLVKIGNEYYSKDYILLCEFTPKCNLDLRSAYAYTKRNTWVSKTTREVRYFNKSNLHNLKLKLKVCRFRR